MKEFKDMKVDFVPMDNSACGLYRIRNAYEVLYDRCIAQCNGVGKYNSHGQDWIYTQRLCHPSSMEKLIKMKAETGVKIAMDFDDDVWHELPGYNRCAVHVKENYEGMSKYLNRLADKVTCTNEFLKKNLSEFVPESKITIIPNALDYNRWRFDRYNSPDELSFFYAGSPTHYDNTTRDYGDFSRGVANYLAKHRVYIQGIRPWFLPKAEMVGQWVPVRDYPIQFAKNALRSKFVVAPLADNEWNRNKSDLKYIECCAVGRVCLCADISTYECAHEYQKFSPNCTEQSFKYIVERALKNYDMLIDYQYNVLKDRWLKPDKYIELFTRD